MRKSKIHDMDEGLQLCVSREKLASMLGCGQATADRIANEAEAKIRIGRRIIIKLDRVNQYLESIAE